MMIIPRTPIMTNNVVSLSEQEHLVSVKKNNAFHS